MKRNNILLVILLLGSLLISGNAAAQMNSSMNRSAGAVAGTAQVEGIWSISLKGIEQVTLALHQEGDALFGSAMSEADRPWNAAVLGQISGSSMELTMTSLQGGSLVSARLVGTLEGDNFKGSFVKADDQGMADSGMFSAVLINPDPAAYVPAKIEPSSETLEVPAEENAAAASSAASQVQPTQLGNPKYRDVHTMAGTVPANLGVGFIGDGTAGAGGMGMG